MRAAKGRDRPTRIALFNLSDSQADFASQPFMGSPGRAVGKSLFAAGFGTGFGSGGAPPPTNVDSPLSRHIAEFDEKHRHDHNQQQLYQQQRR